MVLVFDIVTFSSSVLFMVKGTNKTSQVLTRNPKFIFFSIHCNYIWSFLEDISTVCSLEEVKKSKNEKYINKQVL